MLQIRCIGDRACLAISAVPSREDIGLHRTPCALRAKTQISEIASIFNSGSAGISHRLAYDWPNSPSSDISILIEVNAF